MNNWAEVIILYLKLFARKTRKPRQMIEKSQNKASKVPICLLVSFNYINTSKWQTGGKEMRFFTRFV